MSDIQAWGMVALVVGLTLVVLFGIPWAIVVWRGRVAGRLTPVTGTLDRAEIVRAGDFADLAQYFAVQARYHYAVNGRTYEGERTALEFNLYRGNAAAEAVLAGATVGGPVTVWYDRANPKRAVLDNSRPTSQLFFFSGTLAGVVIALGGALVVHAVT